jgi:hypothetical protein
MAQAAATLWPPHLESRAVGQVLLGEARPDHHPKKYQRRSIATGAPMGPDEARSIMLSPEENGIIVAIWRHTLLSRPDSTIP